VSFRRGWVEIVAPVSVLVLTRNCGSLTGPLSRCLVKSETGILLGLRHHFCQFVAEATACHRLNQRGKCGHHRDQDAGLNITSSTIKADKPCQAESMTYSAKP
jgi:hypothetical protein